MAKALLIDDDKKHSELLRAYFKRCGINRVCAYEVESGFRLFNREGPKLLLLDVMLPDKDGFKISGGGSWPWSLSRNAGRGGAPRVFATRESRPGRRLLRVPHPSWV